MATGVVIYISRNDDDSNRVVNGVGDDVVHVVVCGQLKWQWCCQRCC